MQYTYCRQNKPKNQFEIAGILKLKSSTIKEIFNGLILI